jgi:hypothetical protein
VNVKTHLPNREAWQAVWGMHGGVLEKFFEHLVGIIIQSVGCV